MTFTLLLSVAIGALFPTQAPGTEIMGRTDTGPDALLLAVNVVSVNVAANLVFPIKGVRPRT